MGRIASTAHRSALDIHRRRLAALTAIAPAMRVPMSAAMIPQPANLLTATAVIGLEVPAPIGKAATAPIGKAVTTPIDSAVTAAATRAAIATVARGAPTLGPERAAGIGATVVGPAATQTIAVTVPT